MDKQELEFSTKQIKRLDEIDNATFEYIKVLTEQPDMKWDMYHIGEVATKAAEILASHGFRIRYPFITEVEGEERIFDCLGDDEQKAGRR